MEVISLYLYEADAQSNSSSNRLGFYNQGIKKKKTKQ